MTLRRSATAAMPGIGAAEEAIWIAGLANEEKMAPMVEVECRQVSCGVKTGIVIHASALYGAGLIGARTG